MQTGYYGLPSEPTKKLGGGLLPLTAQHLHGSSQLHSSSLGGIQCPLLTPQALHVCGTLYSHKVKKNKVERVLEGDTHIDLCLLHVGTTHAKQHISKNIQV